MFHVKFADIGEGIHEGVIHKIVAAKGDDIKDGEVLMLIETDKVTAEIPSPTDGSITEVRVSEGQKINVGDTLVLIDDGQDRTMSNMGPVEEESPKEKETEKEKKEEKETETVEEQGSTSVVGEIEVSSEVIKASDEGLRQAPKGKERKRALATPVARKLAKDLGVDINKVEGSGPAGRVMKADIKKAADQGKEEKATPIKEEKGKGGQDERLPLTMLRKTIAENMVKSKFTIPHTAAMDEVDVTELVAYREEVKEMAKDMGLKVTYLPFIIKAIVAGLKEYPVLNASLDEDAEEIILKKYYNIGFATDTPDGLMVPVLKNADQKSIFALAKEIEDLIEGAMDRSLKMDALTGGTFTITNYGAVGASYGVPVIKYPEAAIIGIGTITKKPVVIEDEIVIRSIMPLSISFDHRIMDGADAGRFIKYIKHLLSNPKLLLLS